MLDQLFTAHSSSSPVGIKAVRLVNRLCRGDGSNSHCSGSGQRGLTLIELMIVVVIMGVLLAVAYPSYLDSVRKGRRADGIAALTALQQAQERYRANSPTYGNLKVAADAATLPNAAALRTSPNAYYTLVVADNSAVGYTLTATAVGTQVNDTRCKLMGVQATGGNLRYGSWDGTSIPWGQANPDAGNCWAK